MLEYAKQAFSVSQRRDRILWNFFDLRASFIEGFIAITQIQEKGSKIAVIPKSWFKNVFINETIKLGSKRAAY